MVAAPSRHGAIALALGGGAALGWAHIGVLRVLAEEGIRVGALAGTSIGALAALSFAAGKLDVLEAVARGADRRRVRSYLDPDWRRGAWLGGRRIAAELQEHFGGLKLEELPVPTALIAADVDKAEEVRLRTGWAVPAVQASMALPALFRPVEIEGRRLIDGGMVACLPLRAAREIAPELPLVAVDLMSDFAGHVRQRGEGPLSALSVARSAFLMMIAQQSRAAVALDPPEVLISLPIGHVSTTAFTRAAELIGAGRRAALSAMPAIRFRIAA